MNTLQQKKCGRCKILFECTPNSVLSCNCSKIILNTTTKNFLAKTKYNCICNNCLIKLGNLLQQLKNEQIPTQLIEGVHYYLEGNNYVFTEVYHILRGSCCKNNCRHCAYGYTIV